MLVVFPDILLVKLLIMLLQLLCVIHVLLGRLVVGVSLIYCNIRFRDHINGFLLLASTCLVLHHC
jgi:hypothetical protein